MVIEHKVLESVAAQLMNGDAVTLEDKKLRIKRVGSGRLRTVQFELNGRRFEAIEQNRNKPSRWGQLAREKHQVDSSAMWRRTNMSRCPWTARLRNTGETRSGEARARAPVPHGTRCKF